MRYSTASRAASVVGRSSLHGIRSYATEAPPRRGGGSGGGRLGATLSLEHFLQRSRVLALYRTILRGTGHIKDATTKAETRSFARAEFERHRGVTDLVSQPFAYLSKLVFTYELALSDLAQGHIRYLLSTGKNEWETMERYIGGM
ncbi:hypothetical protein PG994_007141 [Apiospora phragmitis]|uniref:LYR motif-containing protein 2 n=1 Tax=Apiospora phragmitis TaxID=2905665 RepID=A0ABR1V3A0_9PEZI